MKYCLAIDIGASSGRHIVGWWEDGKLKTEEVFRFPNGVTEQNGHLVWNVEKLCSSVVEGIDAALVKYPKLHSFSIDTWGVDYVLLNGDKELLPAYAYRDSRTDGVIPAVHSLVPFEELYDRTGCQFQPFNSLYQLYADKLQGRLDGVTDMLMMPEYLMWKLCGVKAREYTNATTTGLVNAGTGEFDLDIVKRLGLPKHLFPKLTQPGRVIGQYKGMKAVLCATHDTGSAVEGIPMAGDDPYISSGTWSLLGVKTPAPITEVGSRLANYSNEGGVGYNRYQKNIMGMWLVNQLQKELCPKMDIAEIVGLAESSACDILVDANAACFLAPKSMKDAFDEAIGKPLASVGDYFRCAYRSLANSYKQAIEDLEVNTGSTYDKIYIVGGGAKNTFLNQLTEAATGKQVVALPIEATALGNLKIQLEAEL